MDVIKKLYTICFFIGIFCLPFNSQIPDWMSFLGEYSGDSSPIFFLFSFLLLGLHSMLRGKIYVPLKSIEYVSFVIFMMVIIIVTLINVPNIIDYYFKQTTGLQRFLRQLISILIIAVTFFLVFINVCRDYGVNRFFLSVRKTMLYSFILVSICGIIEFFVINHNASFLKPILAVFDYLPFVDIKLDYRLGRVSSTAFEPPALSTYLITISGFMFSYIISSKKAIKYIPFVLVILLALLSKSRTALVAILVQAAIAAYYAYKTQPQFRTIFTNSIALGFLGIILAFAINGKQITESIEERIDSLNFSKNLKFSASENAVSNKSRLGIQYAMFEVYKDNPVFGTGWGQQAFESRFHYPIWATTHNYEFRTKYLNEEIKSFPPGYNMYLRILTETGIIGLASFLFFIYVISAKLKIYYKTRKDHNYIVIALIVSFVGYFLNWLQIDSFRLYGFWICLAILIEMKRTKNDQPNSLNTTLQ